MRLNSWNYVHFVAPFILTIVGLYLAKVMEIQTSILEVLLMCYIIVIILSAPRSDYEQKTGRSFKSQYGKIDEYKTVKGEGNMSTAKMYITIFHIIGLILTIYYSNK